MYEGCLRWSDLKRLTFQDCTLSSTSLRLCIQGAKNDKSRQGQWVNIPPSKDPISSYALFEEVRETLANIWKESSLQQRLDILGSAGPIQMPDHFPARETSLLLSTDSADRLPRCRPLISYHKFLFTLKSWAQPYGFSPADIGTHSLRRGLSSDWALLEIPPHIRQMHGRWRSPLVADSYIGTETQAELSLRAFARAQGTAHSLSSV